MEVSKFTVLAAHLNVSSLERSLYRSNAAPNGLEVPFWYQKLSEAFIREHHILLN